MYLQGGNKTIARHDKTGLLSTKLMADAKLKVREHSAKENGYGFLFY